MTDEEKKEHREKLRAVLTKRMEISRMDVAKLAETSGISPSAIYRIMDCSRGASHDTLVLLAEALQIPVSVLVS